MEKESGDKAIEVDSLRQRSETALNILGSTRYDGVSSSESDRNKFQAIINAAGAELSRNRKP